MTNSDGSSGGDDHDDDGGGGDNDDYFDDYLYVQKLHLSIILNSRLVHISSQS